MLSTPRRSRTRERLQRRSDDRLLPRLSGFSFPAASKQASDVSKLSVRRRLLKQTIAVIAGNLLYFFLLMPHLPPAARHRPDKLDLGLIVDFWICVVVYGVIELLDRRRRASQ